MVPEGVNIIPNKKKLSKKKTSQTSRRNSSDESVSYLNNNVNLDEDPIIFKSSSSRVISKHHERAAEVCDNSNVVINEINDGNNNIKNTLKLINSRILRGNSAPIFSSSSSFKNDLMNSPRIDNRIGLEKLKKIHGRILSPVSQKNNFFKSDTSQQIQVVCFS